MATIASDARAAKSRRGSRNKCLQYSYLPPVMELMRVLVKAIVVVAIVLAGSSVALAWHHHIHPPPDPGVARVLDARRTAREKTSVGNGRINTIVYNRLLQQIDVSDCPKPFQLAWLDYESAWRRRINSQNVRATHLLVDATLGVVALTATGGLATVAGGAAAKGAASDAKREIFDTDPAWVEVEKQAVIFNCPIPSDPL